MYFAIFLFITSCAKDEEVCQTGDSELLGCWETEICGQVIINGYRIRPFFGKAIYEFSENKTLSVNYYNYSLSNCDSGVTGLAGSLKYKYSVSEESKDIDGVDVNELSITTEEYVFEKDIIGSFNIENDRLCTSNNLVLDSSLINYLETELESMDYESCLKRVKRKSNKTN